MSHGGRRSNAGRKKGSLTSKTREIVQKAAEQGITPLEVILDAMMHYHAKGDRDKAAAFAKDAAPYCHPRLSAMQLSGGEAPLRLNLVEEIIVVGVPAHDSGSSGANGHHAEGQAASGAG